MTSPLPLEEKPVSPEVLARVEEAVKEFHTPCMWFRHPEARVVNAADIRVVVRHLREYGGWKAWYTAQELQKCL